MTSQLKPLTSVLVHPDVAAPLTCRSLVDTVKFRRIPGEGALTLVPAPLHRPRVANILFDLDAHVPEGVVGVRNGLSLSDQLPFGLARFVVALVARD